MSNLSFDPSQFRAFYALSFRRVTAAGAGGGLVASIATCPLDVIKTKLQAQRAVDGQKGYQGIAGEGFS